MLNKEQGMKTIIKKDKIGQRYLVVEMPVTEKEVVVGCNKAGLRWSEMRRLWWTILTAESVKKFLKSFPDQGYAIPQALRPKKQIIKKAGEVPIYLMDHQKEGLLLSDQRTHHLYAYDTGTGKTAMAIEIHRRKGVKTLVVAPLSVIEAAWVEDLKRFAPAVKRINLWSLYKKANTMKGKRAYKNAMENCDLAIINFEGVKAQLKQLEDADFEMLIIDESSKVKNPKSKITKTLIKFSGRMDYVYLFSGTPAPNSMLEYYPQVKMLDSELLGKNFYVFRNRYFRQVGYGGFKWIVDFGKQDALMEKLSEVVTVKRKEDVLDNLPERTDNLIKVQLSKDEKKIYKEMCNDLITKINDNVITSANAAVKLTKLREITSGFLLDEESEVQEIGASKLNALEELIDEIGNHQLIIWTQFIHEATKISVMLSKKGITWGAVNGSSTQKVKDNNIRSFKRNEIQIIIAHPRSMAHGVTLVNCNYCIYYNMSYSYEEMYQSKDRIYRYGQKNACSYYYILASGTVDEIVYKAVAQKGSAAEEVLTFLKGGAI